MSGRFEILSDFPSDVVAVSGHGRIDSACYEDTLVPAIERDLASEDTAKLLSVLEDDFEGFTAGAAWDDAKIGFTHLHDFARIALVTDVDWLRKGAKLFAPLLRARFSSSPSTSTTPPESGSSTPPTPQPSAASMDALRGV